MAFLSSGLSKLIENVPDDNKLFLKAAIKERWGFWMDELTFLMQKGQFAYEWLHDIKKWNLPVGELNREYFDNELKRDFFDNELEKEYFDNELKLSKLNEKEWEDILHINGKFEY